MAPQPFALYGSEKMIYDVRMGPQAVCIDDTIYAAYQANPDGPEAHPHVIAYSVSQRKWPDPVRVGTVPRSDHHLCPVLWADSEKRIHILYGAHAKPHESRHIVSAAPGCIGHWEPAPEIAPSISYPRLLHLPDGRLLLFYRVEGHLGYWTYSISGDGGCSWQTPDIPPIDFDHNPQTETDRWAGSYHGVALGHDGRTLHLGFVHWDEKRDVNPLYGIRFGAMNRYHLYYARIDLETGGLFNADGQPLERPLTRRAAEACKLYDSGHRLTNMPTVCVGSDGHPILLYTASEETPWTCAFNLMRFNSREWTRTRIAETNHIWSGSHLTCAGERLRAFLVIGKGDGSQLSYGGGIVEEWESLDGGASWKSVRYLVPEPGLLYNNPKPVERPDGSLMDGWLMFYGWEGPPSIQLRDYSRETGPLRGKAYLWHDGEWL